jgi:invasion protein IalB
MKTFLMKRISPAILRHGAAALIAAGAALALPMNAATAAEPGQKFKAWEVKCESGKDDVQVCHIFQEVSEPNNKQKLLHIAIGYLPEKPDKPVAFVTVPLGVLLPAGISLQIDGGDPVRIPLEVCLPTGCRSGFALNDKLLAAMKNGVTAKFTFYDMARQEAVASVSLSGFTAGITAVKPAAPKPAPPAAPAASN